MDIKLFDSELKVMDVLWKQGDTPAREIARALGEELGWNVNTTYTLIKRCMKKGAIERAEPGFLCHALLPKAAASAATSAPPMPGSSSAWRRPEAALCRCAIILGKTRSKKGSQQS